MIHHYVKCGIDTLDSARELLTSRPAPVLGPHGNFRSKWGGGSPSTAPSLTELPALLDAPAAAPENHLACSGHCVCRGVVLSGGETGNCTTAPARTCTPVRETEGRAWRDSGPCRSAPHLPRPPVSRSTQEPGTGTQRQAPGAHSPALFTAPMGSLVPVGAGQAQGSDGDGQGVLALGPSKDLRDDLGTDHQALCHTVPPGSALRLEGAGGQ